MKRNIVLLIIFYVSAFSVSADTLSIDTIALSHFNKGIQYYNANNFNLAIIEFSNAIDIFPEYADAYLERGNSFDNKGNAEKALENYLQAGTFNEEYLIFAYGYKCASSNIENYDEAIIMFSKCIDLGINLFISYCMRGNSYGGSGNYKKAINDYNEAIKINPNIFQPYFSRGSKNVELGNIDQAIIDYEISVKLCPDYYLAFYYLSLLYHYIGNANKAEEMMMLYKIYSENINI